MEDRHVKSSCMDKKRGKALYAGQSGDKLLSARPEKEGVPLRDRDISANSGS